MIALWIFLTVAALLILLPIFMLGERADRAARKNWQEEFCRGCDGDLCCVCDRDEVEKREDA